MTGRERLRLGLLRVLGTLLPRRGTPVPDRPRLLVLRPDHIGDLLWVAPALEELRRLLPDAQVTLAVGPWVEPFARRLDSVDAVQTIAFPGFRRDAKGGVLAPYRLAFELARRWRGRFDACLVARADHWWGAMTAALAGVPHRIGRRTPETTPFLTASQPPTGRIHEVVADVDLARFTAAHLRQTGTAYDSPGPVSHESHPVRLLLPPDAHHQAAAWARTNLGQESGYACVHPGAGGATKLWPIGRYQSLVRALAADGRPVVVTGSAAEAELVARVAASGQAHVVAAAGEFSLLELAALFASAALVVGSDSGPLHVAVAMGTPTVHIYGPADEVRFGPWGPPSRHRVITAPVPCRPCGNLVQCTARDELGCMRRVSTEAVLGACLKLLAADGAAAL